MSDNELGAISTTSSLGSMQSRSSTSDFCFIAGVLHQGWFVMDHGDTEPYTGLRFEWRPVPSFETMEEAEKP